MTRLAALARGLLLSLVSIFLTLGVMEVVLRLFFRVTDDVEYVELPGVGYALRPGEEGRFIRSGGIDARFKVNAAGWNAPREYVKQRTPGKLRVAVVGDSFVEAMHVDPEQSFAAVLERGLRQEGMDAEVYSFGVSGFGTSQVLHLIRDYVLDYSPDLILYLFIRNDASDSCKCMDDKNWTVQYALGPSGELEKMPFMRYHMSAKKRFLRHSALARYLLYQRRLLERLRDSRRDEKAPHGGRLDSCETDCWKIVGLLLQETDRTLQERGVPWLLVWEGDADPAYAQGVREHLEALAADAGLPYRDLSPGFRVAGRLYRFEGDGHWNVEGHRIAGEALVPMVHTLLTEGARR